jgi:hypothetical protein
MSILCEITGNPSGTDTWMTGKPCHCQACASWMMASIAALEAEVDRLRKALWHIADAPHGDLTSDTYDMDALERVRQIAYKAAARQEAT